MNRLTVISNSTPVGGSKTEPRVRSLESRLEDGYSRIDQARARGEDVTAWEEFWIGLLRQYEETTLSLADAA